MNEILFIIGMLAVNYLILHYPIAFVNTLTNGLQPIGAFVLVFVASKLMPSVFQRRYSLQEIIWKTILCIIALLLIYRFYML